MSSYAFETSTIPVLMQCETAQAVCATRSIRADRSRLFMALTVPEYVEAWFSIPGAAPGYTRVLGTGGGFSIRGIREENAWLRLTCTYKVCRRSKLIFTLMHAISGDMNSSLVRIRLQGDFDRTTVHVTHDGLSPIDQPWWQSVWEVSLENLGRLF